ncbi:MAG: redoxin domain-containing protein [Planctomycetota bacterium]
MRIIYLLAFIVSVVSASQVSGQTQVDTFSLPTTDGETVALSTDPTVKCDVICFLGTECPLAKIYASRLQRMSDEYAERGVRFIGINSNVQDSMEELSEYGLTHGLSFPLAKDFDRRVALQFGATRTPEVFVVDRMGVIRYQGRIDDQFQVGVSRKKASTNDLRDAIEQLVTNQPIKTPRTTAVGCLISLPRESNNKNPHNVTFCNQVVRVLQQHCIECHRDGEIGPFVLDQYDEVVGWADMCLEVMDNGRMPPWHANPNHGSFLNARQMSDADKLTFQRWVEVGMPYGNASDLPEPKQYVSGWRLSAEPDAIFPISNQPFSVPADGTVEYQYFVIDPGFKEERWVRAAQVIPGNAAVVHHCIAFTRPPDSGDFRDISLLSAYVPGQIRGELPSGYAQRIAPGSKIVFQMHYTPTGKTEQDLTRLGLVFADRETVTHEVYALAAINHQFEIPPNAAEYPVKGNVNWFPKDGSLLAVTPHMHLRGKSFQFNVRKDDQTETLLDVPAYDFNWQHNYELTSPMPLESVDQLKFTAVFDNSNENPNNPDPNEYVSWGDQTWQEMALAFITVAQPMAKRKTIANDGQVYTDERSRRSLQESEDYKKRRKRLREQWIQQAESFADRYMKRFDRNGDDFITEQELPDSVRMFGFWDMDHDGDDRISREEIQSEAYDRAQTKNLSLKNDSVN